MCSAFQHSTAEAAPLLNHSPLYTAGPERCLVSGPRTACLLLLAYVFACAQMPQKQEPGIWCSSDYGVYACDQAPQNEGSGAWCSLIKMLLTSLRNLDSRRSRWRWRQRGRSMEWSLLRRLSACQPCTASCCFRQAQLVQAVQLHHCGCAVKRDGLHSCFVRLTAAAEVKPGLISMVIVGIWTCTHAACSADCRPHASWLRGKQA